MNDFLKLLKPGCVYKAKNVYNIYLRDSNGNICMLPDDLVTFLGFQATETKANKYGRGIFKFEFLAKGNLYWMTSYYEDFECVESWFDNI